jgi:3-oxoacyl-[acyl-carrier-protein] synthase II
MNRGTMKRNRVVITGMGTLNAIANNPDEYARALKDGVCGIGPVTVFDTSAHRTKTGGEVKDFSPRAMIPPSFSLKRMSRSDLLAMAATVQALRQARLFPFPESLGETTGVSIGGGAGGMLEGETFFESYAKRGRAATRFSPLSSLFCASSADHIASAVGLFGPKTTFMTACSSGATAVGFAADQIRSGRADVMIAGGTEPLSRIIYAAFNSLRSVDPEYCKPFDKNRQGLSLGEGAGIFIMESPAHAAARGVPILAEVLGYGVSCDSHHMTAPDPEGSGAARAMKAALADAGVAKEQIEYINAHGTATPANDAAETRGIKALFEKRAYDVPVSSTKSMIAHTLGAAGALEGMACILAMANGFIPPTVHLTQPDPECDLDYVPGRSRKKELSIVLSNSFAFGGNNTSVIYGRYTEKGIVHE